MIEKYFLVFLGGGIGAVSRYGLAGLVQRISGIAFPIGTMSVNVLGSLLIGLIMSLSDRFMVITPNVRVFLTIGTLGGFTTFSTFSYETMNLMHDGEIIAASLNVTVTVIGCLAGVWAGTMLGEII